MEGKDKKNIVFNSSRLMSLGMLGRLSSYGWGLKLEITILNQIQNGSWKTRIVRWVAKREMKRILKNIELCLKDLEKIRPLDEEMRKLVRLEKIMRPCLADLPPHVVRLFEEQNLIAGSEAPSV